MSEGGEIACPPPVQFRAAGDVLAARIASIPPFVRKQKYTGRRLDGIKYEKKVQAHLSLTDENYIPGFWLHFLSAGQWKWCQPDGIRFDLDSGRITVVEVKYRHTSDAWWQTKKLYYPVLRAIFPESLWSFDFCEVVKWFDPSIKFPEEIRLTDDPFRKSDKFKVHIWKP